MSADAVYHEMGLQGYRVDDTWQGKDGALYVLISSRVNRCVVATVGVLACIGTNPVSGSGKPLPSG